MVFANVGAYTEVQRVKFEFCHFVVHTHCVTQRCNQLDTNLEKACEYKRTQ